jgi:hypothetical protein
MLFYIKIFKKFISNDFVEKRKSGWTKFCLHFFQFTTSSLDYNNLLKIKIFLSHNSILISLIISNQYKK